MIGVLLCQGTERSWLYPNIYGNIYVVISLMIRREHGIQCPLALCEMLPEIYTAEKFDFLKSIIHSQII